MRSATQAQTSSAPKRIPNVQQWGIILVLIALIIIMAIGTMIGATYLFAKRDWL